MNNLKEIFQNSNAQVVEYNPQTMILKENETNEYLYYVLFGQLEALSFQDEALVKVFDIPTNSLLGLFSFFEKSKKSFFSVKTITKVLLIKITKELDQQLNQKYPEYRHLMMNQALKEFRIRIRQYKHLQSTLAENAERMLVQEKMATVGRFSASLAHELNNNVTVVSKGIEFLKEQLPNMLTPHLSSLENEVFLQGIQKGYQLTSRQIRQKTLELLPQYSSLQRRQIALAVEIQNNQQLSISIDQFINLSKEELQKLHRSFLLGCKLKNMAQTGIQISHMINQFKALSRPPDEMKFCDITETIENAIQLIHERLKNILVQKNFEFHDLIWCRPVDLIQLWVNLLVNAVDAMQGNGEIVITVKTKENHVLVKFQDSGPGIPDDKLKTIFQPHVSSKNTYQHYGLGLGLTICSQVVSLHHGLIHALPVEKGACIEVLIPIKGEKK